MPSQEHQLKNTTFRRIAQSVAAIFSAEAISLIGAVALSILIGRLLGASALGIFSYSFTLVQLARIIVEVGFDLSIPRELADDHNNASAKICSAQNIKIQLWLITVPLLIIVAVLTQDREGWFVTIFLGLWLLPRSFTSTALAGLRGTGFSKRGATIESFAMAALYALSIISITIFPSLLLVAIIFVLVETVKAMWLFHELRKILLNNFSYELQLRFHLEKISSLGGFRKIFSSQAGLTSVNILSSLQARAGILALGWTINTYQLGEFSAATRFLTPLRILPNAFFIALLPEFSKKNFLPEKSIWKIFFLSIALGTAVSFFLWLIAPELMRMTFGFERSVGILRILSWSFIFVFCNHVLEAALLAQHREKFVSASLALSNALLIFGILILSLRFGVESAAWLIVIAEGALTLMYCGGILKHRK